MLMLCCCFFFFFFVGEREKLWIALAQSLFSLRFLITHSSVLSQTQFGSFPSTLTEFHILEKYIEQ